MIIETVILNECDNGLPEDAAVTAVNGMCAPTTLNRSCLRQLQVCQHGQ